MTKNRGIMLLILFVVLVGVGYIVIDKYNKINTPPPCTDEKSSELLNDILKIEFGKISRVFNQSEPINYRIKEVKDSGVVDNKRICYAKLDVDNGKEVKEMIIGYEISNEISFKNFRLHRKNDITIYGLYNEDNLEKKTKKYSDIKNWINK